MSIWKSLSSGEKKIIGSFGAIAIALIVLAISSAAAWVTHVVVTIIAKEWIFLAIGAFVPPIGVIHGWMVWLGFA